VDVSSIGSVAERNEMPNDFRCDRSAKWSYFFARETREVKDNDEMNLALVRPAVLEKPLQLRAVGGLCALPFFPEPLENFVALPATVLVARRALLEKKILPKLREPVRYAGPLDATLPVLIESVKAQGLEGLVAKRLDSRYEAGLRSGAWQKMRVNRGQEFVIGGYTVGTKTFDALIFGYYEGDRLIYAARTRNGFTPVVRTQLFKKFRGLEIRDCPFVNLPEAKSGRWGAGLTAAKMKDCRWLKPVLVAQIEFLEWTGENHLRHTKFIALREDKQPREVRRE
jgi:bifunctional non-homologous end joining protein LigD